MSQRGGGALVLDSPLLALRHLIELLANDSHNPPLRAGEVISTGTFDARDAGERRRNLECESHRHSIRRNRALL